MLGADRFSSSIVERACLAKGDRGSANLVVTLPCRHTDSPCNGLPAVAMEAGTLLVSATYWIIVSCSLA